MNRQTDRLVDQLLATITSVTLNFKEFGMTVSKLR